MATPKLRRELRFSDLFFANMAGIIGSGWLFGALYAANIAGPASIVSWFIGGVLMLILALVYAELGGMLPKPGALVRYPQFSHGSLVSFILSWSVWLAYATVAPLEAEASVQYASYYAPSLVHGSSLTPVGLVLAAVLVVVFFILNYFGVRLMSRVNSFVTILKIVIPAGTILVLLFVGMHPANFSHYGGFSPGGSSSILSAIAVSGIALSYTGFRQALDLAGEAKNPARDVPRAVIAAILVTIVIYTLLEVVFVGGLTPHALAHGWAGLSLSSPFADLAVALNLGWLATILFGDAVISPAGTGLIATASTGRVVMAMVDNGYLPDKLGETHPQYRVPTPALWVNLLAGIIFLLPYQGWASLVTIVSSTTILSYILGPVSAAVLRRTAPDIVRTYSVRGLGWIAPAGFVVASLIIYWSGWPLVGQLMIALAVGLVIYGYYYIVRRRFPKEHIRSGLWLIGYLVFMGVISKLGSFGSGANVIPYPYDMLVVVAGSLAFFYWGIASALPLPSDSPYRKELGVTDFTS